MDIQKVKELALANGFKLKEQADGSMDLNAYVYDFANAIEREAKAQAVPEGFVLVPKEPTQKMLNAGHVVMNPIKGSLVQVGTNQKRRDCYKAMIEAAQEQAND